MASETKQDRDKMYGQLIKESSLLLKRKKKHTMVDETLKMIRSGCYIYIYIVIFDVERTRSSSRGYISVSRNRKQGIVWDRTSRGQASEKVRMLVVVRRSDPLEGEQTDDSVYV